MWKTCFEKVILKSADNLHEKYEKPERALKDEFDMQHQRQVAHYFHFFRGSIFCAALMKES